MAARPALLGLLLVASCSAISFTRAGREHTDPPAVSFLSKSSGTQVRPGKAGAADRAGCEEALPRSACFNAVVWLRQEGFDKHPEWYPGYSSSSTFWQVQEMLNRLGKARCPRPCLSIPSEGTSEADEVIELEDGGRQVPSRSHLLAVPKKGCHDAVEGEWCHHAIAWLRAKGLEKHPDWYPELSPNSSSFEIQLLLHAEGKSDCQRPCEGRPEPVLKQTPTEEEAKGECFDARPDSRCYTAVAYGLAEGLAAHPEFYPGLSVKATFKQVQEVLYLQDRFGCERPCPERPVPRRAPQDEEQIERSATPTRVQDMNEEQLNSWLDGDWNGVPTTSFNLPYADQGTSTFEKALHRSTTEPFVLTTQEPAAQEPAAQEAHPTVDHEPLPELGATLGGAVEAANATKAEEAMTTTPVPGPSAATLGAAVEAANATKAEEAMTTTPDPGSSAATPGGAVKATNATTPDLGPSAATLGAAVEATNATKAEEAMTTTPDPGLSAEELGLVDFEPLPMLSDHEEHKEASVAVDYPQAPVSEGALPTRSELVSSIKQLESAMTAIPDVPALQAARAQVRQQLDEKRKQLGDLGERESGTAPEELQQGSAAAEEQNGAASEEPQPGNAAAEEASSPEPSARESGTASEEPQLGSSVPQGRRLNATADELEQEGVTAEEPQRAAADEAPQQANVTVQRPQPEEVALEEAQKATAGEAPQQRSVTAQEPQSEETSPEELQQAAAGEAAAVAEATAEEPRRTSASEAPQQASATAREPQPEEASADDRLQARRFLVAPLSAAGETPHQTEAIAEDFEQERATAEKPNRASAGEAPQRDSTTAQEPQPEQGTPEEPKQATVVTQATREEPKQAQENQQAKAAAWETPEEMESRIRAEMATAGKASEPQQAKAVAQETPEEMESRIRAEMATAGKASEPQQAKTSWETPEEMESRIRAEMATAGKASEPQQAKAVAQETPEEMESRIRAEMATARKASEPQEAIVAAWETPEEMESRIRAEMATAGKASVPPKAKAAAARETPEEMESRIRAEMTDKLTSSPPLARGEVPLARGEVLRKVVSSAQLG